MSEFDFLNDEKLSTEEKIAKAEEAVTGLKDKNTELLGKQVGLRADYATLVKQLSALEGIDPDELIAAKSRISELEGQVGKNKLGDNELQEIIAAQTAKIDGQYKDQLMTLQGKNKDLTDKYGKIEAKNHQLHLGSIVLEATAASGARTNAIPIITKLAAETWKASDSGEFTPQNEKGETISNSDGTGTITMSDWVEGLRVEHDYLFSKPKGGNLDNDKTNSGKNIGKLSEADKRAMIDNNADSAKDLPRYA